jgi:hypothetical protein
MLLVVDDRLVLYFLCCLDPAGDHSTRDNSSMVSLSELGVKLTLGTTMGHCGGED